MNLSNVSSLKFNSFLKKALSTLCVVLFIIISSIIIFLYFCLNVSIPILLTFLNSSIISLKRIDSFKFNSALLFSKYLFVLVFSIV